MLQKFVNKNFSLIGLVGNRIKKQNSEIIRAAQEMNVKVLGCIPEDENVTEYDSSGNPIINLPDSSPSVIAVEKILNEIGLNISSS